MKKSSIGRVASTLSLCFVLAPSLSAVTVSPQAQKVLENHLRARGGFKTYQQFKTRRTVAVARVNNQEVKTTTLESLTDGKFYQALDIPMIGKTEVGFDGRRVWQRSAAAQGLMEENDPRARAVVRSLRAAELWDYKKDDRRFDYGGKDKLEGVEFDVLLSTYTTQDGKDLPARYYFDPEGALRLIAVGEMSAIRLEFSDFRPVEGITYPFRIKFTGPDTFVETVVQEIKHNVSVEGATFEFRELLEFKP